MKKTTSIIIAAIIIGVLLMIIQSIKQELIENQIITLDDIIEKNWIIKKPLTNKITKSQDYALDCKTNYYTAITFGGDFIKDSSIRISEGQDRAVLYVEGKTAKYYGADYVVLLDDSLYLIIMRTFSLGGLTEVVSINKDSGIGIDMQTVTFGLSSGQPKNVTYSLKCLQL